MNQAMSFDIADISDNDPYDDYVSDLADSKSDELISNGQIEHAQSIIRNLLSHAENEVRIFTSCLHPKIYCDPRVVEAASAFLERDDVKIKVLIQDANNLDSSTPFFKLCSEHDDKCIVMEVVTDSDRSIKQHMVVMDQIGFRFCADMDKNEAIASFNAPGAAKNLAEQFDILFGRANKLELNAAA